MKIITFDIEKDLYQFEIDHFKTELHRHPAAEIVVATQGHFTLQTSLHSYPNLTFAFIEPNLRHQLYAENCQVSLFMAERNPNNVAIIGKPLFGIFIKKERVKLFFGKNYLQTLDPFKTLILLLHIFSREKS